MQLNNAQLFRQQAYIDGQWLDADDGQTIAVNNPATGASTASYTDIVTTAAVFAYDQQYIDGTLIRQGDQLAYCAPATEPKQGDQLTWQGVKYTVVSVKPVSPAGVPVIFAAQIRA